MLSNLERIHARAQKRNPSLPPLSKYKSQTITKTFKLTSLEEVSQQNVDFPSGSIVVSVCVDATKNETAAASDARGDLSAVRVAFDLPSQDGTLTAGGPVKASCLFGRDGSRQWPEQEVVIPRQGSINLTIHNLTTDTLDVDVAFNVLLPRESN
jgi:hypothetical protein